MVKKTFLKLSQDELTLSDVEVGRAVSSASFAPSKSASAYFQTLRGNTRRWNVLYFRPTVMHMWSELDKGWVVVHATTDAGSVTYTWSIRVAVESVTLVGSVTICERWKYEVAASKSESKGEVEESKSMLKSPSKMLLFISDEGTDSSAACKSGRWWSIEGGR